MRVAVAAIVEVLTPAPVELQTGSSADLRVVALTADRRSFHNCSGLRLSTTVVRGLSIAIVSPEGALFALVRW